MAVERRKTDWDSYYKKRSLVSSSTQKITQKQICKYIKKYMDLPIELKILELGGANSCFFDYIVHVFAPKKYAIIDNSQYGLDKFKENCKQNSCDILLINEDILKIDKTTEKFDFTYSIGLIEHFDVENTKKVMEAHFKYTENNGIVLVSFPTPTLQYRFIRKIMEILGVWKFYDERPLKKEEILPILAANGDILEVVLIRRLPLTQMMCVIRKNKEE